MSACKTPLSWLVLERHHLGELPPSEDDTVGSHVRACAECRALLARIAEDDTRPLPALPVPARTRPAGVVVPLAESRASRRAGAAERTRVVSTRGRVAAVASGIALAAALLVAIGRSPRAPVDTVPAARTKGGGVSFALVREDEALLAEAGGSYRDGERFKALVTCPPGLRASFDLAVFDGDDVSFPLAPSAVACGNAIPLPGAFRATGRSPMTVCLVWDEAGPVDRAAVRRTPPELLVHAACKALEPAP